MGVYILGKKPIFLPRYFKVYLSPTISRNHISCIPVCRRSRMQDAGLIGRLTSCPENNKQHEYILRYSVAIALLRAKHDYRSLSKDNALLFIVLDLPAPANTSGQVHLLIYSCVNKTA